MRRWAPLTVVLALCATVLAGVATAAPNREIRAFPLAGVAVSAMTAGPGASLWYTGVGTEADRRSVLGSFTANGSGQHRPSGESPNSRGGAVAVAPDGSVWFTDPDDNSVGRYLPAVNQLDRFPLPTAGAQPGAIAYGPGNAMWFVEEGADRVGRIGTDGAIAEFPLDQGALPSGIVAGGDGALWVVEKGLGRIVRMAPTGAISDRYVLPDPASRPHAIVVGVDGNLWFSEEGDPQIGRIGTNGTIDEFRIPGDLGTRELALGADGNLWFTTGSAIGSINAKGATGEPECFVAGCGPAVNALAKGPEGAIWFASSDGRIGRFVAPALEVRLGASATRPNDGLTTIALSCHGGTAGESCRGWLRLTAKLGGRKLRLDQHRYRLQPATGRRLPLRLGMRGQRALASGKKRLAVRVVVTRDGGDAVARRYVLQARGRR